MTLNYDDLIEQAFREDPELRLEDATRTRPEVEEAFREAEEAFEQEAREAYERLREAAA